MSDAPSTPTPEDGATPPSPDDRQENGTPADLGDAGKKALDAERARAKEAEKQAKALEAELEKLKQASMSDQEKVIAEAVAAAKAEALAEVGSKVAVAEFKAAAAGRLKDDQLSVLLSSLDLKAFLDDDGDVDPQKVSTFLESIVPKVEEQPEAPADPLAGIDLGQGARGVPALNSKQLEDDLRRAVGAV